jgi:hypothetical protein
VEGYKMAMNWQACYEGTLGKGLMALPDRESVR